LTTITGGDDDSVVKFFLRTVGYHERHLIAPSVSMCQGSETQLDTQKTWQVFLGKPT